MKCLLSASVFFRNKLKIDRNSPIFGRSVIIGFQKTQIYQRFAGSQQEVFILYFRCILNSKQSDFTDFFHS